MSKIIESNEGNYVEIVGIVKAKSEKAILFNDGDREVWLPISQIEDMTEEKECLIIVIPEWLAIDKGLV